MTTREQNIYDLKVLISNLLSSSNKDIDAAVADLSDAEISDLVDKQAYVNEWLGLA